MISRVIANFPTPYEDELFYHTIARAMSQTAGLTSADKNILYFGGNYKSGFYLPQRIFQLSCQLGGALNIEDVIQNNSIFPYYNIFLSKTKQIEFVDKVLCGNNQQHRFRLGQKTSLDSKTMRYCPHCLSEQKQLGLPLYPRREWQLPGIEVCPFDHYYLKDYPLQEGESINNDYLVIQEERLSLDGRKCFDPLLIKLSEMALNLFDYPLFAFNKENIQEKTHVLLRQNGYYYKEHFNFRKFYQDFYNYYPLSLLDRFKHRRFDGVDGTLFRNSWMGQLFFSHRSVSIPLQWLLVINFFGLDLPEFLEVKVTETNYFPHLKWKRDYCLNPFCYDYKRKSCKMLSQTENSQTGYIKRINYCPSCKMVYSIDNEEGITIIQKGDKWFERLKFFYKLDLDQLASYIDVTKQEIIEFLEVKDLTEFTDQIIQYRSIIIDSIIDCINNEELNLEQLKKDFQEEYDFLKENDNFNLNKILIELSVLDEKTQENSPDLKQVIQNLNNLKLL